MKRRDFFKGLAGVIAGLVVAPIVVKEIKETNESGFFIKSRSESNCKEFKNGEFDGFWDFTKPVYFSKALYRAVSAGIKTKDSILILK